MAISEENMKMMKKLGSIESELSKKKMDQFGKNMKKYGKLAKSTKNNNAALIDDMFYRNYKL